MRSAMNPVMSGNLSDDPEDCLNLDQYLVFDADNEIQFQGLSQLSNLSQASEKAEPATDENDFDFGFLDDFGVLGNPLKHESGISGTDTPGVPMTPGDMFGDQQPFQMPTFVEENSEAEKYEPSTPSMYVTFPTDVDSDPKAFVFLPETTSPISEAPKPKLEENNNNLPSPEVGILVYDSVLPTMCYDEAEIDDIDENSSPAYGFRNDSVSPPWSNASTSVADNNHLSDDELIALSTKELNRRMQNLTKSEAQILKQRRRTLKNRGYAQICRHRRINQHHGLQEENDELRSQLTRVSKELQVMTTERNIYKRNWEALKSLTMNK